ncbi:MAG: phage tail protein, partial [Pantoea sp.]|nr:phage tail protein [Pantoea sp.]
DKCEFYMCSPSLLDNGDPPSGVVGKCVLYQGTFTQGTSNYLSGVWNEPDMSAFRPLLHMVMEKCYLGNSDTPPPISIIARRCPNQLGLTGGRHNVNGDSNIACAVYEVMTNNMWGMKIPEDKIDIDSFRACGNLMAEESLGISMLVQTAMLGRDLMAEMLRHADGVVYADPVTGLYTMTLAREFSQAEKDALLVIDDSSIIEDSFDFSRTSWEMTKNTIIVEYTDRLAFETKPVQYQDLANIDVRGGMIDAETFSYLGFSNDTAAMNTAARVSKMKASPLVSAKMSLKRVGYRLRPGSGFWLRKPDRGLANVLMRVIEISYGTLDDPAIKITAMEDIFEVNA